MKIYIGADHRGFELKGKIKNWLSQDYPEIEDLGAFEYDQNDDYPLIAEKVAQRVSDDFAEEKEARGIIICGSGAGVDIVANKFKHIRSGLAINHQQVKKAREDDDINILALSAEYLTENEIKDSVKAFLSTSFSNEERKKRRLEEIDSIEDEQL
ncbi:MAG: RpiB/LacA/LacB family sugar-phosphate isomerase [Patescibacteria group bacterium]